MSLDLLRYELRLVGRWVFLTPVCIMAGLAVVGFLLATMYVLPLRIAQIFTGGLEMLLPMAAGVIVASLVSHDPAVELQLTMPRKYRFTVGTRIGMVVGWIGMVALVASTFIYHWKYWRIPAQVRTWGVIPQVVAEQCTWLAPLLWLSGVGLCLALLLRSRMASGAILAGLWIIEAIFYGYFIFIDWLKPLFLFPTTLAPTIDFWLLNRGEVTVTAVILLVVGWFLLHNTEALLMGSAGEE